MPNSYGIYVEMTPLRALRVLWWRVVRGMTWRAIAYMWIISYRWYAPCDLKYLGNQLYGLAVCEEAAHKLKFYPQWIYK
jgi:hypothetical protein